MKLILESWRKTLNEEKATIVYDNLIKEFVEEIKSLEESKAELNEILSSVKNFATKAYNTYKKIKTGTIETVLKTAIDSAIKLLDSFESKIPNVAAKLKSVLNKLKQADNMTIATSLVSIIVGLLTGGAIDALVEVLDLINASPNLIMAFEAISKITAAAEIGQLISDTGKLMSAKPKNESLKEIKMSKDMKLIMENFNAWVVNEEMASEEDFSKFFKAVQDNIEDFKNDNEGRMRQDEAIGTAFMLWTFITKGAALAGLAEIVFKMIKKLLSKARQKFDPNETKQWKAEQWSENLEAFFLEVKRGFATGGGHTFLKYFADMMFETLVEIDAFSGEAVKKKIDDLADGLSIIVAVASLVQAGVLKTAESILQNKNALFEIFKSIIKTAFTTGKGLLGFVDGVVQVLGGGFDIYSIAEAIRLFKSSFVR